MLTVFSHGSELDPGGSCSLEPRNLQEQLMLLVMKDLESNVKNVEADAFENLHLSGE